MDDGRVSYEEAVEAIRRFGYAGVEREEDEVTLYADDVPYCYEFLRRISEPRPEFTGVYNTRPQEKEPWPYRLVAFLNRCLEILINSILEGFV